MGYVMEQLPEFREADEDGLVGLRGYLNYFQDCASSQIWFLGKGNDHLREQYGKAWMYTKYRMRLHNKVGFGRPIRFETWIEKSISPAVVWQDFVMERDGELLAEGRLESCLFDLNRRRLVPLKTVEFHNDEVGEDRKLEDLEFERLPKKYEEMEYAFSHTVTYSDLDQTGHMTNLKYISLLMDAYDSAFYHEHAINSFEIHFLSQCMEHEELKVYRRQEGNRFLLTAEHADGTPAVTGFMEEEIRA